MLRRALPILVALAMICVLAVGCGDSGDETTDDVARLTKAELIKQGDAICVEANERRLANLKPFLEEDPSGQSQSRAEKEEVIVTSILPPFQEEAEQLAELNPPEGDEDELNALVAEIEAAVERIEQDPSIILAGAEKQFGEAERIGREYGFKQCGRS